MPESDKIRRRAEAWIKALSGDAQFHLDDLYRYLYDHFEDDCERRGTTAIPNEPWYKHDARQAVRDCKIAGIIVPIRKPHTGHYKKV